MIKVFLDTNILIDYLSRREPFFEPAALIFQLGKRKKCQLLISSLSFATASFLLQAHYKLSQKEVIKLINQIIKMSFITTVDSQTVSESVQSDFGDFEDAMQYFSALREDADFIITRNTQDFAESSIPVFEPFDFLKSSLEK
jgi:predicted nucleic-acid-binding protein